MAHKFKVGQMVDYKPGQRGLLAGGQAYQILKCLPQENGQYLYRIKTKPESFERIARESELDNRR